MWSSKWPILALSKHRKKKKVVSYCLRIYFLLFINFALQILELWFQRPSGFPSDHLLHFTDQEFKLKEVKRCLWLSVIVVAESLLDTRSGERHSCYFLLRKDFQAEQHLEPDIRNISHSYREFCKQDRGTFIKGIIDQLLLPPFICST